MSADVLNRVWRAAPAGLTAYERLLLVRLAWYADDAGGNCYAAVSSLARETCATDRGVRNAMGQLRKKGLVVIDTGKGPRGTNRVALSMPAIEGLPLNVGSGLNSDAGVNGGSGLALNGGSVPPEPPCSLPLNGGSANKQEIPERNKGKTESAPSERKPDGEATTEDLHATGLTPQDFASYMLVRRKRGCSFVDVLTRERWIAKFRGFHAEGKDTSDMLHQMIEGRWQRPVEEKWKKRPQKFEDRYRELGEGEDFFSVGGVQ